MASGNESRRSFVRSAAGAAGALALAPSLSGLVARSVGVIDPARTGGLRGPSLLQGSSGRHGYGPLAPAGPELELPQGFSYTVLSRTGQPMSDGSPTPTALDGMAAFAMPDGHIRLLRNHENRDPAATSRVKGNVESAYDQRGGGGVSTLEVRIRPDGTPELVRDFMSLNGTIVNCAGGPTPWGSWLSCEESVAGPANGFDRPHGYIFEVAATADREVTPVPLKAMGRFVHEAVAVDARTGIVYETEDQQTAGFYRFIPGRRGDLAAGGQLQMLAVRGRPQYDTSRGQRVGESMTVTWVDIENPDPPGDAIAAGTVFREGAGKGGARFTRLEGCWSGDDSIYFLATTGGDAQVGQVWQYRPGRWWRRDRLTLVFESPSRDVLDQPDNIAVSPRGGIVICEDGPGEQYLRGLTPRGEIFDLAKNILNQTEFAGTCFSPDGRFLFVNIMGANDDSGLEQGLTLAIHGPWERGAL